MTSQKIDLDMVGQCFTLIQIFSHQTALNLSGTTAFAYVKKCFDSRLSLTPTQILIRYANFTLPRYGIISGKCFSQKYNHTLPGSKRSGPGADHLAIDNLRTFFLCRC